MTEQRLAARLQNLEYDIEAESIARPEPMIGDKWLLSSALQKAIRRGETDNALRAAYGLWCQDRQSFWRRLHIISIEDIGVGNVDAVVDTLTATSSAIWRRRMDDLRVGLHLVRNLASGVKCRAGDELILQVERAPENKALRESMAIATDESLAAFVTNDECDLIHRSMALWNVAGTRKYPSELLPPRKGEPADAAELLIALDAPVDLVESCISVMHRTGWPLAIFTPLIWQEVQKHRDALSVLHTPIPSVPDVDGLPIYAADMFTRTGQGSFRQLQRMVPALKRYSIRQIGLGVFYRDGGLLDKTLMSPYLDAFRQAGEAADIEGNGLCLPSYMGLREILAEHAQLLAEIRIEQLSRHLAVAAV